ncbi:MAG: hypothetical protein Q7S18_03890 [bacterium]|nr:hypothetical protein [bacterium]
MKTKLKKLDKKTEEMFKASSVAILLENLTDNIGVIAEGQMALNDKFDGLERKVDGLETRFDGLEKEMREGFSMIMDYLKRIDEEVVSIRKELEEVKEKKVDWSVYSIMDKRMKGVEKQMEEFRILLKEKKILA